MKNNRSIDWCEFCLVRKMGDCSIESPRCNDTHSYFWCDLEGDCPFVRTAEGIECDCENCVMLKYHLSIRKTL